MLVLFNARRKHSNTIIFLFKIKKKWKKNEKDTRASKELYKAGLEGAERYQDRL